MNLRIITKNHGADPETGFLKKSISKPNGCATAMSTAWEVKMIFWKIIISFYFVFYGIVQYITPDYCIIKYWILNYNIWILTLVQGSRQLMFANCRNSPSDSSILKQILHEIIIIWDYLTLRLSEGTQESHLVWVIF